MFIILSYDVNQKRVKKVMKICRKYLVHVQRSVFEGVITETKLKSLKKELQRIIDFDNDAICIYETLLPGNVIKEQIGMIEEHSHII